MGKRAGVTHKLFFFGTNHFVIFDFPGSSFTRLNGINRRGIHLRAAISTLQGSSMKSSLGSDRVKPAPPGSFGPAKFSAPVIGPIFVTKLLLD